MNNRTRSAFVACCLASLAACGLGIEPSDKVHDPETAIRIATKACDAAFPKDANSSRNWRARLDGDNWFVCDIGHYGDNTDCEGDAVSISKRDGTAAECQIVVTTHDPH